MAFKSNSWVFVFKYPRTSLPTVCRETSCWNIIHGVSEALSQCEYW